MTRLGLIFLGLVAGLAATAQQRITDTRDQTTYEITQVGNTVWTKANLKYNLNNRYFLYLSKGDVYYHASELGDICPDGWRVPTLEEWQELDDLAPLELKPTGILDNGRFADYGKRYYYWTSSEDDAGAALLVALDTAGTTLQVRSANPSTHASCRCVEE